MGLMDKVKAQATQLAEKAQEAGKAGQAKLEEMQSKRHADSLLHELGLHTFLQHKGRANAETPTKVSAVIAQIDAHEAEHGPVDAEPAVVAQPTGTTPAPAVTTIPTGNVGGIPQPVNEVPSQPDAAPSS